MKLTFRFLFSTIYDIIIISIATWCNEHKIKTQHEYATKVNEFLQDTIFAHKCPLKNREMQ